MNQPDEMDRLFVSKSCCLLPTDLLKSLCDLGAQVEKIPGEKISVISDIIFGDDAFLTNYGQVQW